MLILAPKERIAQMQFCNNTTKTPYIYLPIIGQPKNNLRSPIISTLYIGVYSLSLHTAGPEINDLDPRLIHLLQQNILWLQISMDDPIPM